MYGGIELEGSRQSYLYFLVAQNGTFLVKHRAGNEITHDIQGRTPHSAVVTPDAPLRLSLYVDAIREPEIRKGRDLGQFSRGNASDQRTRFRINLWSNRRDSVIGGRRDRVLAPAVDELHVEITLDSRSDGRCVWQGEAVHRLDGRDEQLAAEQLIPLLIDRLGRSASAEPIELE